MMSNTNPEFIKCAMEAFEEGIKAQAIEEECACRLSLQVPVSSEDTINP